MKRRPRFQIKPNIGTKITSSPTKPIDKANGSKSDTFIDNNQSNNNILNDEPQTSMDSAIKEPLVPHFRQET